MKRSVPELLGLLRSGDEQGFVEAKRGFGDSTLSTVSAFSNEPGLGGGYLVFGVEDGTFAVVGVDQPEDLEQRLVKSCCDQTLNRPVRPSIWTEVVEGRPVVVAFVPEARASDKPIYLRRKGLPRGAFRRIGSGDVRCSDDDIRWLHQLALETPHEESVLRDGKWTDLDPEAIAEARRRILKQSPASEVKRLSDEELVVALGGGKPTADGVKPTLLGLLLFGTWLGLRTHVPLHRIDYIRVAGTQWMEAPTYEALEFRKPLFLAVEEATQVVLDSLPKIVSFREGSLYRVETSPVPERALREAIVNAVSHRDYRWNSPIQILRYSNRIEVRNAGHALVAEEELGVTRSASRNPRLAAALRKMGLAENKGTGIRVMRREMDEIERPRPSFESSRARQEFAVTFLLSHLFDEDQLRWLGQLEARSGPLARPQRLALVFARETGAVRNANLRDLAGLDTLEASKALTGLRDAGLLAQQGASSATHYVLALAAAPEAQGPATKTQGSSLTTPVRGANTQGSEANTQGSEANTQGSETSASPPAGAEALPAPLRERLRTLSRRARWEEVAQLIEDLCAIAPRSPSELAKLLGRKTPQHLGRKHLWPMARSGRLERTIPDDPDHPFQAYRTPSKDQSE